LNGKKKGGFGLGKGRKEEKGGVSEQQTDKPTHKQMERKDLQRASK
jgi:hypothetical protein